MKEKITYFLVFCLLSASWLHAQERTVSGKITSSEDGKPLAGVSVLVSGAGVGTQSNIEGHYSLATPENATLIFSSVGYGTKSVRIGSRTTVDMQLSPGEQNIEEVVVNTGYTSQSRREVAGAVGQIRGDDFENQAIVNFQQALQGRMAGVNVRAGNGLPGGNIDIRIRGAASFSAGTQPLYIVDGIQMSSSVVSSVTQSNSLAGISINDIETIEVIKDAATASIYGAQAANGVVLITTKKGKAGKTTVNLNTFFGTSSVMRLYNSLNTQDYLRMRGEALQNANPRASEAAIRDFILREIGQPESLTDEEVALLPTYDWQGAAFRDGLVRNYEAAISGGNEKTRYYLSLGHDRQEAVITKADFRRSNANLKLEHEVNAKFKINAAVNIADMRQNAPFTLGGSQLGNPAFTAAFTIPAAPIYNEDGTYFGIPGTGTTVPGILNQNIIAVNDFNTGGQNSSLLLGSIGASYQLLPELVFRTFNSTEQNKVSGFQYRDPRTPDGLAFDGSKFVFNNDLANILSTNTFVFTKAFDEDHKMDALAGFEYRTQASRGTSMTGQGFPSFRFRNLSAAGEPFAVGETWTGFVSARYLAKATYSYKGKYIITTNVNYSGSSRFGEDNLWGWFPGVSAAWNIDQESFLQNTAWISALKMRAGFGQTGNDQLLLPADAPQWLNNFRSRGLYTAIPGGTGLYLGQRGIALTNLENRNLRWERKTELNLGVDYGLFNNRVYGAVDVFESRQTDMLLNQPVVGTSGFQIIANNVASISTRGIEVDINTVNVNTSGGFRWNSNFNFTYVNNKIRSLYGGLDVLPTNVNLRVGQPLYAVFTFQYAGVNPATGRPMWYDQHDELTYQPVADDRRFLGQVMPTHTGGFANDFSYKGFDLSVLFQYQYGAMLSDGQALFAAEVGNRPLNSTYDFFEARWTTPGQLTHIARPYHGGAEPQGFNRLGGSAGFWSTDMIRLKNIQVGYAVPERFLERLSITRLRLFFQGNNVYTWTNFPGYDPEFLGAGTGLVPQFKNYTFGLQLGF